MIRKKITLFVALFAIMGITMLGTQTLAKAMDGGRTGMSLAQNQAVTDKKAAIQQKLTTMKETRTTKLEAKRLEICQQHQQKINNIISQGTEQNTKQLAVFQKIEANVKQFYIDKKLSNDGYATAVANADTAEANAVAAIEISTETTFSCALTDSTNPGGIIKEVMATRHSMLAAYRTAIKDLIVVVKKSNGEQTTTDTTTTTNSTKEQ